MCAKVARRGSSGATRPKRRHARPCARGPEIRTIPIPPRPGGVAIATIVSSVANTGGGPALLPGDDHGLEERVTHALGRDSVVLGHGEVNEPACVRIERANLLRHAAQFDLAH